MKNRPLKFPIPFLALLTLALYPVHSQTSSAAPTSTPAPPHAASGITVVSGAPTSAHLMPYTIVAGDSITRLADKFNTTRKKLKDLNHLTDAKLTPGQVILVPAAKSKQTTAAKSSAKKSRHAYAMAQPVQDFDIPASTFASCPVPVPSGDEDADPPPPGGKPAPIAKLVSPAEMSADAAAQAHASQDVRLSASLPPPRLSLPIEPRPAPLPRRETKSVPAPQFTAAPPVAKLAPSGWASSSGHASFSSPKFTSSLPSPRLTSQSTGMNSTAIGTTDDWGLKFTQQARALGDRGIEYDDDWRPPGERTSWTMDCSNTTRYLYQVTAGIKLPRTASDQYYYLRLQGKAWDVPTGPTGWADGAFLRRNLKPGDLLFWENTYRPERQPPITHVMVYLGTNAGGQWLMAGSQGSSGGEHNRRNGGPDIYIFRPSQACGGYTSWFVHHQGRFCAFGRPLEADPSKFALNN